ncbi:unnamed protein product, partial [Musa acuminata var. zebrina]
NDSSAQPHHATPRLTSSMAVAVLSCSSFDGEGSLLPRLRPSRSPSKRENRRAKRGMRACMNPRDLRFLSPVVRSVLTSISVTQNRMLEREREREREMSGFVGVWMTGFWRLGGRHRSAAGDEGESSSHECSRKEGGVEVEEQLTKMKAEVKLREKKSMSHSEATVCMIVLMDRFAPS